MRKGVKLFLAIAIIIFVTLVVIGSDFIYFVNRPLLPAHTKSVTFLFKKDTPLKILAEHLATEKLLKRPRLFVILAYLEGVTKGVQAGEYQITSGMTSAQLLYNIAHGKVLLHDFTIIPGWTFKRVVQELENTPALDHTLQGKTDDQIMLAIGHSGEIPEGRFFPDTYKYGWGTKDMVILQQAYNLMQRVLAAEWQQRDPSVPYSCSYKALIVASIIEREASIPRERRLISGIIIKRLKRDMLLQLDPTLQYGLNKPRGKGLTLSDLRSTNSYNTYRYKGLPPTPICMPSLDAIAATLHPEASTYLFFVSKNDGSHNFSATLQQHNLAVDKYQ